MEDAAGAQKKHKPEEIVAKLRQVDVFLSQGRPVAEAIRTIGVTAFTYYPWRKEFGGPKSDQVKRLKDIENENERLRKAVSDLTLEKLILAEAARWLLERWPAGAIKPRSYGDALQARLGALEGSSSAESARDALIKGADDAGILDRS
ncbi:transposase InsO family protein [Kaistia geumhonensis]|uniref:Transposase InsO family protein n=1 Tax=Kaistia geumhonensis TaxID=410839 RepID=A0ABU0M3Y6_9HYPH|nr:transposase InsO family protein [Kaistia geumhonensis]